MMRCLTVLALTFALASCDSSPSPTPASSPSTPATPDAPAHNYNDRINGVYYYVNEVSDNDKANGQAAGAAVGFKYLGVNEDGEYTLGIVGNGQVIAKAYCHNPCAVIRLSDGETTGFGENSVIGNAFEDAFAGQLEQSGRSHR